MGARVGRPGGGGCRRVRCGSCGDGDARVRGLVTTKAYRAVAVALVLCVGAAACGTAERPGISEGSDARDTSVAAAECPDGRNCVATSNLPGVHPVYETPADEGQASQTIERKHSEVPVVFLVIDEQPGWLEVYLPVRPNGSTGWVRRSDVDISVHDWRIEVQLAEFELTVYEGDQVFRRIPIAVAADNTPTPGGVFYTTELLQPPEPDSVYGTFAYGLSGYSDVLEEFNGGPGQLGIHGTDRPDLIGQKVSNGCIRMANEDVEALVPVLPLGVPVEILQELPSGGVADG